MSYVCQSLIHSLKTASSQDNKVVKKEYLKYPGLVLIYKIRGKLEHLAVFLVGDFFLFACVEALVFIVFIVVKLVKHIIIMRDINYKVAK